MEQKHKGKKSWKWVLEDNSIIFAVLSLIGGAATLFINIMHFTEGSKPWWEVLAQVIVLLFFALALVLFVQKNRRLTIQLETKHLPVCFVVNKTAEEAQSNFNLLKKAVTELTGFSAFDKIEGFTSRSNCLIPHERNRLPSDMLKWKGYIADSIQSIRSFANGVPETKIYHIAVDGPITLSLGLGAVFGTKHPLVFYHYDGVGYTPVLNLTEGVRRVKAHLPAEHQYQYFKISYPETYTSDLAVVLGGASHEAPAKVRQYLKAQGINMSIAVIDNTYGGNLTEKDWLVPVQELFSIFHNLSKNEAVVRFHLFYSMPVAFGFGLGMALGTFLPVTLYNWEATPATYYPVLKLNELGVSF